MMRPPPCFALHCLTIILSPTLAFILQSVEKEREKEGESEREKEKESQKEGERDLSDETKSARKETKQIPGFDTKHSTGKFVYKLILNVP